MSDRGVLRGAQSKLRLDHYLARELPDVSRAKLQHGIRLGLVTVNGNPQVNRRHSQSVSLGTVPISPE